MKSLNAIVIGHYAVDGKVRADHYNLPQKARHNVFVSEGDSPDSSLLNLYKQVIETLSIEGHMVLNAFSVRGTYHCL